MAEICLGMSANCPADVLIAAGISCRDAGGACDVAERCPGMSANCPPAAITMCDARVDAFVPPPDAFVPRDAFPRDAFVAPDTPRDVGMDVR